MEKLKAILFISYFAFLANNSFSQVNDIKSPKHSHPEYEKEIQEMKTIKDNADKTYQLAQETYKIAQDYDRKMDAREKCFLTILSILMAITFSGAVVATIASVKAIKNSYENKFKENYEKIAEKNSETIKSMIINEEWSSKIRKVKSILVLNKEGTGMNPDFMKVISTFENYKFSNIKNLEDSLSLNYSDYDLVVIENCDESGYWKLTHDFKNSDTDIEIQKKYDKESKEIVNVNNTFIKLGDLICPETALIYYGKQGKGFFPSEKVNASKQHMISFANTPSTLFGNMIDLLRYKDIIEGTQKY